MLMSAGLPVSANATIKDVGVHTKVSLNVRHRVVSPARIAERTASPEIRLKQQHTSGLRGSHQHLIAEAPVREPETLAPKPGSEHTVLLSQVVNHILLLAVDPVLCQNSAL